MALKTPVPAKKTSGTTPQGKSAAPAEMVKKPAAKVPVKAAAKPAPPDTITVKHLAAALSPRHELSKKQADAVLLDVFDALVGHLKAGSRVKINGLGIIEVKSRPARMGRNPATGEAIQIKASKKIAFRASKDLKAAI